LGTIVGDHRGATPLNSASKTAVLSARTNPTGSVSAPW